MNFIEMWGTMGPMAKGIGVVLVIMSMISFGVAIERIYTFMQARKQSKLYAPQVAKHLKEGRLKDAIAISSSKNYRYSHLAKVVLAGLQEYQFQQEAGGNLSREDLVDTVRRAIQRASALTANDLKKGVAALATIGATAPFVGLLGTVIGIITAFQGIAATGSGGLGAVSADGGGRSACPLSSSSLSRFWSSESPAGPATRPTSGPTPRTAAWSACTARARTATSRSSSRTTARSGG